jgi:hypothetical protein
MFFLENIDKEEPQIDQVSQGKYAYENFIDGFAAIFSRKRTGGR